MPARSRSDTSQETSSAWAPEVTTAGIETVDQGLMTLLTGWLSTGFPARKKGCSGVLSVEGGQGGGCFPDDSASLRLWPILIGDGGIKGSTEPSDRSGPSRWRLDPRFARRLRRSFQR